MVDVGGAGAGEPYGPAGAGPGPEGGERTVITLAGKYFPTKPF
ncbi:hypothetical protein ACFWUZ_08030 [Streptomyces sp. NPDC058646]